MREKLNNDRACMERDIIQSHQSINQFICQSKIKYIRLLNLKEGNLEKNCVCYIVCVRFYVMAVVFIIKQGFYF